MSLVQICLEEKLEPGCDSTAPLPLRPGGIRSHLARLSNVPYRKRSLHHCMEDLKSHVGKLLTVRGVVLKTGPLSNECHHQTRQCPKNSHKSSCSPLLHREIGQSAHQQCMWRGRASRDKLTVA